MIRFFWAYSRFEPRRPFFRRGQSALDRVAAQVGFAVSTVFATGRFLRPSSGASSPHPLAGVRAPPLRSGKCLAIGYNQKFRRGRFVPAAGAHWRSLDPARLRILVI